MFLTTVFCFLLCLFSTTNSEDLYSCSQGEIIPSTLSCQKFQKCYNGVFHEITCPDDLHFNPVQFTCDLPEAAGCLIECTPTENPFAPDPTDCQKFKKCFDGRFVELLCPDGLHFNPPTNQCLHPENAECTVPCTDNTFIPDLNDCQRFQKCLKGEFVELMCPDGFWFNPETHHCDLPENAGCIQS